MNVWMELKRALTVMDHATRSWGRELGLDECGVMVLALLGEEGPALEWTLGMKCGRARQQVHRSLCAMKERGLVRPDQTATGRNKPWELTERGRQLWGCLERGIREWQAELESRIDVGALKSELQRVVEIFLNRPRANGGWRRGLAVPLELLKVPIGVAASMQGLLEVAEEPAPDELRAPPGHWGPPEEWTAAERNFIASYWRHQRENAAKENCPEEEVGHDPVQSP